MRRSKGYRDELEKLTRDDSDLTLTVKLKAAATKKLRLRVIGYSQVEYYYNLSNRGMIMSYIKTMVYLKKLILQLRLIMNRYESHLCWKTQKNQM